MLKHIVVSFGLFCSFAYGCGPEDITPEQLNVIDCIEVATNIRDIYSATKGWSNYDTIFTYHRHFNAVDTTEIQDELFFDNLNNKKIKFTELVAQCKSNF